jgi:gluconokinase
MIILLMGVSGAGKTTVGTMLAERLGWEFADADDYHSAANVEKMRTGIALTDADRVPWLETLRQLIFKWIADNKNAVLACSALKDAYRKYLQVSPEVRFVYLQVKPEVLAERLRARHGHYMTEKMLASQLAALEEPGDAITIDANQDPAEIIGEIKAGFAHVFPPGI